jgi:hypothetical protein
MRMVALFNGKKIITVSGWASGIGKTLLCEHIIGMLPDTAAVKITITDARRRITDADEDIMTAGKDTCRFKARGAAHVIWIQSPEDSLPELLRDAERRVPPGASAVLLEGNSALGCLTADCAFFVCDPGLRSLAGLKPSRQRALAHATVIILNARAAQPVDSAGAVSLCRAANPRAAVVCVDLNDGPAVRRAIAPILACLTPVAQGAHGSRRHNAV